MYNAPNYLYLYNYYCIMILMMCNVDRKKFCLCYTSNIMSDIFNDSIIWFDNRIRLIRFIYYIYIYRLLYYLPMERMKLERKNKNLKENLDIERRWHLQLARRVKQLEEENKTLKDNVEFLHSCLDDRDKSIAIMQEENKKLNIKVASLEWEVKWLNYTIEKLKEENQTLELWLDRKEKLNEKYRKEIDKLKSTYVYDAKQVRDIC